MTDEPPAPLGSDSGSSFDSGTDSSTDSSTDPTAGSGTARGPDPLQDLGQEDAVREDGAPGHRRRTGRRVKTAGEPDPVLSRPLRILRDAGVALATALLISLLCKHVLVSGQLISDPAMEPTLRPGDRVFANVVDLSLGGAERGDVVVFDRPESWADPDAAEREKAGPFAQTLMFFGLAAESGTGYEAKRVIAVGGDRVTCCTAEGLISVNDTPLEEPEAYLHAGDTPSSASFDLIVPDEHYFLLGDHRSESIDSRSRLLSGQTFVSHEEMKGTAFAIGWPLDRVGLLPDEGHVFDEVPSIAAGHREPVWG